MHMHAFAQTGYVWAKSIQGPGYYDYGMDVSCAPDGKILTCGDYEGPSDFGGTQYAGQGSSDMYTCRLGADGTFEWVSVQGTASTERNFSVSIGPDQHIYTCGYGKVPYPESRVGNMHQWDAITARIRPNGTVAWGRAMQGDVFSESYDIVADAAGNSYTVGQLKTHGWYGTDTLAGHGATDAFIVKFDSVGNYVWGKTFGGTLDDFANTVGLDYQGNVWVGGSFEGLADFDGTTLLANGGSDPFLAKLDASGNVLFVKTYGGQGNGEVLELGLSADGDCYFTGNFDSTLVFPSQNFTAVDATDFYYAKVDGAGNFSWARQVGGLDLVVAQDLEIDDEENIYIGGYFWGMIGWQTANATSMAYDDMFFAKTDSNGVLDFMEVLHDLGSIDVFGVAVDAAQNMLISGSFSDTTVMGGTTLYAAGFNTEIFIAKYATRAPSLAVLEVLGTPYCSNDQFQVDFQARGYFPVGNVFYLELSDANGSFSNPTTVGSLNAVVGGRIMGTIPGSIVAGTQYRMRIRASQPNTISLDNGSNIVLNPNTSIPVNILGDTLLCNGQPVVLSVAGGFVQQVWSTGDTGTTIQVLQPGVVWVEATDSNGCTNRDEVLVIACVSAHDQEAAGWLRLLPNPASFAAELHLNGAQPGLYAMAIMDLQGKICVQRSVSVTSQNVVIPIDLSMLTSGIYLLQLQGADARSNLRIVIQ